MDPGEAERVQGYEEKNDTPCVGSFAGHHMRNVIRVRPFGVAKSSSVHQQRLSVPFLISSRLGNALTGRQRHTVHTGLSHLATSRRQFCTRFFSCCVLLVVYKFSVREIYVVSRPASFTRISYLCNNERYRWMYYPYAVQLKAYPPS